VIECLGNPSIHILTAPTCHCRICTGSLCPILYFSAETFVIHFCVYSAVLVFPISKDPKFSINISNGLCRFDGTCIFELNCLDAIFGPLLPIPV
jgi:hypothetical protein